MRILRTEGGSSRLTVLTIAALIASLGAVGQTEAQQIQDIQKSRLPLLMGAQGSFIQGGVAKKLDSGETITVDQMYFEYMVPFNNRKVPVVITSERQRYSRPSSIARPRTSPP